MDTSTPVGRGVDSRKQAEAEATGEWCGLASSVGTRTGIGFSSRHCATTDRRKPHGFRRERVESRSLLDAAQGTATVEAEARRE